MLKYILIGSLLTGIFLPACRNGQNKKDKTDKTVDSKPIEQKEMDSVVYQSENLTVRKISEYVYEHTSYLATEDFGKVPCNGMVVVDRNEAVVFDTPADGKGTEELINYFINTKAYTIKAVIATHFHEDCVGGIKEFHAHQIPSYANNLTIALLKQKKSGPAVPENGFDNTLELSVGDKKVEAAFFGEGHTKDNIVGYFPEDKVLFGGCLIKEDGAGKGNLEDADVEAWSETVEKIKQKYPQIVVVIPGHGERGGIELLDYTIQLFE